MSNNVVFGITLKANGAGFTGTLTAAGAQLKQLGGIGAEAGNQIGAGMGRARAGVQSISEQLQRLQHIAQAYLGGRAAMDVIRLADQYVGLQARLKQATTSQLEFNTANAALYAIAQRNGVPLAESLALYSKLAPALRALGGTQAQTLEMTDLAGKSLRLSGASAAQSAAAMMQLSQALGSGVLRGDEFNSLMENSPRLMMAVADGMGKPIGALRKMAEEGELTAGVVVNALLSQKQKLESEYGSLPLTVSAAWVKLGNAVTREIGRLDKEVGGATGSMAAAIGGLADNLAALEAALISAAKVAAGIFVASLVSVRAAAVAAAGMAGIGMLRNAVAGLVLLYEVGGIAGVAKGILGIGSAASAAALTLSGAIKGIVWPAALAYGVYEFGKYVFETFKSVRLYVTEFVATVRRAAAYLAHPIDAGARNAALKAIQDDVDAVWAMEYPAPPPAPKPAGKDKPLKTGAPGGFGNSGDTRDTALRNWLWEVDAYYKEAQDKARERERVQEEIHAGAARRALEAQRIVADSDPIYRATLEWEKLQSLVDEGLLTGEQAGKAYQQSFGEMAKAGEDGFERLERAARGWGTSFTDALTEMVKTGKLEFRSLADSIISDMLRMQIQKSITDPLLNMGTAWLNGLGGSSAQGIHALDPNMPIVASAAGNVFAGPGIGAFSGQVVARPTLFPFARGFGLMGEAGPEAILPLRRDGSGRLGVSAQGGGGTYYIDARGADATALARLEGMIRQLNGSVEHRAVAAVANARLRGGSFSAAFG